ncbi:MAG: N-acetylmuramoyl-L-alanine amidase [Bacteroidales bacterium]|nr:N-acetylmuramoyl-L-alanine amidase [Bacteroidales bacterium]
MAVKIVLHCSDSGFGNAALIAKWHSLPKPDGRGWSGIGYHYVILNGWLTSTHFNAKFDGYIETGRPLNDDPFFTRSEMGAHVKGFNTNSIGICLIGKSGKFTNNQLNAALKLISELENQFVNIEIHQHSELDKTKPFCAGLDMIRFKQNYQLFKNLLDQRR